MAAILFVSCFVHVTCFRTGRVIDAETGKPIDKAVVCYFWPKYTMLGRAGGKIYETTTSINGKYFIPPFIIAKMWPFVDVGHETIVIYKDGYAACLNGRSFYGDKSESRVVNNIVKLHRWREGVKTHKEHLMFIYFPYGDINDLLDKELYNEYSRQP